MIRALSLLLRAEQQQDMPVAEVIPRAMAA
jgi:hypothetical protein